MIHATRRALLDSLQQALNERDEARAENEKLKGELKWETACKKALMESQDRLGTQVVALSDVANAARDELHCYSVEGQQRIQTGQFQHGHRCVTCDENVDRNGELRARLDAALADSAKVATEHDARIRDEARLATLAEAIEAVENTDPVEHGRGYMRTDDSAGTIRACVDSIRALAERKPEPPTCATCGGPAGWLSTEPCPDCAGRKAGT